LEKSCKYFAIICIRHYINVGFKYMPGSLGLD
jgi:hypothetical protein